MRTFYKTLVILGVASILNAATTYVSTITGTRVVTGYFNETNSVTIIITLDGDDRDGESADKSEQYIELYVGFNTSATVSTIATSMSALSANPIGAAKTGSDNTHTFTVSAAALEEALGASAEGKFFDFTVTFSGAASTHKAVTPSDGGASHKYDRDVPALNVMSYPASSNQNFNDQKVIYQPDETLFQTPATYQSYVKFLGDGSGSGADNGVSHIYNFAGGDLNTGSNITKDDIEFTSGGDLVDGAGYDISFFLYDVAGNDANWTYRSNVVYDTTVPRIASAASGTPDGTHIKDDNISVELTFSEPVYTTGVMNVVFTMDGTNYTKEVPAFASRGAAVSTTTFTYTVQDGNETSDLTIASISMAGGAFCYDRGLNAMANFAFTGNNLGDNANHVIDGKLPTITNVTSDKADGTYGVGEEITATATFSEAVTLSGGDFVITMETGGTDRDITISAINSATTAAGLYTVQTGDVNADLTATNNASTTGAIKDAAGNSMVSFTYAANFATKNIVIETTPPEITNITSDKANGTYGVDEAINITVTFDEAVTLSGAGAKLSVELETGAADATIDINTINNSSTATGVYTVAVDHTTAGAKLEAKSPLTLVGALKDQAGNAIASLAIPNGQNLDDLKNIKIDAEYPTITNVTSDKANDIYKIGDVIDLDLTFSEEVTLANGTLDLVLNHGNAANATVSVTGFGPATTATTNYTVVESDEVAVLDHNSIALDGTATLKDAGGNQPQVWTAATKLSANKTGITIDGVRPIITKINSTSPAAYYKVGDVIPVTITFSENVSTTAANIIQATLETGAVNADAILTYGAVDNEDNTTQNYTVRLNDFNASLNVNGPIVVTAGQRVNDQPGNEMVAAGKTIPTGKNLADEVVDIFVDGVLPVDDGTDITMSSKGGNVVANIYNDTNTSVDFVVSLVTTDGTLTGGTIQMVAKIEPNGWTNIGGAYTIKTADVTAGQATVNVLSAPIEALTSFATDGVIKIKATVTDKAGNSNDWAESANTLTIDVTAPTIASASSTSNAGVYKATDNINVTLGFSEAVTMHNDDLDIILNTSATIELASGTIANVTTKSATYTVAVGERTPDIAEISSATLAVSQVKTTGGELRDQSGNPMVLPVTNIPIKIADAKSISVDGVAPTALTVDKVIATGNTVRHKYWNAVNTGVEIKVPLTDTDKTLIDGQVKIKAKLSNSGTWDYIGDWSTITSAELTAKVKVMTLIAADIAAYTGADANIIEFTAGVQDKAGNETEWIKSTETLIVDKTPPVTQQVTATITAVGGNVVANYWNSTNTSLTVKVDFPVDATLETGEVVLTASEDGANYFDFGDTTSITAAIYAAQTVTVSVDDEIAGAVIGFEELPWFSETDQIQFRAKVLDRAGNETHYTVSTTKITVKEIVPTVTMVTSANENKAYKAGETLTIQVVGSEVLNVTGTPQLTLETGVVSDAVISYISGTTTATLNFTYPIVAPHTSLDLNYFDPASLVLNGGTILDNFGNPLTLTLPALDNENSLGEKKNLVIDTTPPSVRFTYDDPDSLVRIEDATLLITATFSDDMSQAALPQISVDYPGPAAADLLNQNMLRISDKVYTYEAVLVDNSDGIINVTVTTNDKALNPLIADSTFDGDIVTIDNTDPIAFSTGLSTLIGDTVVGSWFNDTMEKLDIVVPIDITDNSLLRGNIQIQMHVDGKMASDTWVTIPRLPPDLPKDSIQVLAATVPKHRTRKEIIDILSPQGLAQGDSVFIRALINDQVGNTTIGKQSESFFQLDTLPPTIPNNLRGFVLTEDAQVTDTTILNLSGKRIFLTSLRRLIGGDLSKVETIRLWTNDSINFATQHWEDPKEAAEVDKSGIARYQYALYESANDDENSAFSLFKSYKTQTDSLDTVIVAVEPLTHNRWYHPAVQAVDTAGNISDPLIWHSGNKKLKVFRHNARPEADAIADTTAYEDVLLEKLLTVNDKDLKTFKSDKFSYALTTMKLDTTKSPIDSAVVTGLTADVTQSGKVSFTPTKLDTADYLFRVVVTDDWDLKDTVDINITSVAVNDPPVINLASIKRLTFFEGMNSDSINLTRFVSDEDNDTTDLKYTFRIASTIPTNISYPTAKLGFLSNFNTDYKKLFINNIIDEFPTSTIIQKNNSFIIYPANETNFIDPIKVDSLAVGDSVKAWITQTDPASADSNYYTTADMIVEFTVIDPAGLSDKDTVTFFINPLNDPPVWAGLRDTVVKENDSLFLSFADYLTDVDDSTLTLSILPLSYDANVKVVPSRTFEKKATGYVFKTSSKKDKVNFKPSDLWFKKDYGPWNPKDTLTNQIKFKITATDDDTSAIDTFIVKVQRVPRPEIRMYVVQNNAFTNYYEIFLVDSVGKTRDLTLNVQSKAVTLDTVAAYTYVGHSNFTAKGEYILEVAAKGIVGDTLIQSKATLIAAKMYGPWVGNSPDGQFQVVGQNGSVDFDQSIMIVDSTLFEPYFNDRASYLLGNEAFVFRKSVQISMPGQDEEMAIYRRSTGSGWIELPSLTEGNRVNAYSEKMGYFRIGPKTLFVPGQTSLHQNYPNPFNPLTTIEYDLGFIDGPFQRVNVAIYDILGRNIKTLVNDEKSIGRYQVKWNGKDQDGVPVSSGIYFVNLLTEMGRSQTKKIMLLR